MSKINKSQSEDKIIVVGAGIVGVSSAIALQRMGKKVVLIDKTGPAAGASFGNGGVLASCSVVPVTGPGLLKKAPLMLLNKNQPLFLKWGYLPKLMPWLARYLSHANANDTQRISNALMPIIGDSLNDHLALAKGTGAEKWIKPCDYLYLYNNREAYEADAFGWSLRRAHGFEWDELEGQKFRDYDDGFSDDINFAVRLGQHGRITSPGDYVSDLAKYFQKNGGELRICEVEAILSEGGAVCAIRAGGEVFKTDKLVITAGIWSKALTDQLGLTIPMETERGYHMELWEPSVMPRAPVMVASGKFVATPMEGRMRLAGVVEFGGLKKAPSEAPFALLERNIRSAMPNLRWGETTRWMGHRPAPSDSIPIIGEMENKKGIYLGFGHHHVGLTGGPKTGRLLASLVAGLTPNQNMSAYKPERFAVR